MLWHKAWLETRWRFISALVILTMMAGSNVFDYLGDAAAAAEPERDDRFAGRGSERCSAGMIRDAIEVQKDFRGFIWYQAFRQNLTQMGVFFAILLGCGGLLTESSKGSALFTLSLPVTRRQLLGARTGTGLAQLLRDRDGAAARRSRSWRRRSASSSASSTRSRTACASSSSRAVFFSLASFLSTLFADIWRPLLIADRHRVRDRASRQFAVPQLGIFSVMNGETYFRTGSLPWTGFLTSAVIATALLYSAAETLERRDF